MRDFNSSPFFVEKNAGFASLRAKHDADFLAGPGVFHYK